MKDETPSSRYRISGFTMRKRDRRRTDNQVLGGRDSVEPLIRFLERERPREQKHNFSCLFEFFAANKAPEALAFDGSDDSLTVNNSDAYKPAAELSLLVYTKFDIMYGNTVSGSAEDGTMTLLAQKDSADGNAYTLYKTARNALAVELSSAAASGGFFAGTLA